MNHRLFICICALLGSLSMHALGGDNPNQPQDRKVRVVCRFTETYFDGSVSLKPFVDDISPRTFLETVADQKASRNGLEWITWLRILRWNADSQKYVQVERLGLKWNEPFLNKVQDGDFLLFNSPVCRFWSGSSGDAERSDRQKHPKTAED